ncbi:hypothetical protein D3C81_1653580 [compost metagenome]
MTVFASTGVQVKTHHGFSASQMRFDDLVQRAIRPARRAAAVKQSVGMAVLTTLDNRHHRRPAVFVDLRIEQGIRALALGAVQIGAGVDFMQCGVCAVIR